MDNQETLARLGTQDTGRRQTKLNTKPQKLPIKPKTKKKLKRCATRTQPKIWGEPRCSRRVGSSCVL